MHRLDQLLPEGHGFRVRVVHAEDFHALVHPEEHHVNELAPQVLPVRAVKVQRVDVLVFFGRILRVADTAVRPLIKPLRVLPHIRMIRGAVDGEVERDFQAAFFGLFQQPDEIVQGAQFWLDLAMPARGSADGPRAAHIVGMGGERVVFALSGSDADGMDGREINHIEAHRLCVIKARQAVAEGAVPVVAALGAPREKLIPCREPRPLAFDNDAERLRGRGQGAVGIGVHEHLQVV